MKSLSRNFRLQNHESLYYEFTTYVELCTSISEVGEYHHTITTNCELGGEFSITDHVIGADIEFCVNNHIKLCTEYILKDAPKQSLEEKLLLGLGFTVNKYGKNSIKDGN